MVLRIAFWLFFCESLLGWHFLPVHARLQVGLTPGVKDSDVAVSSFKRHTNRFLRQTPKPITVISGPPEDELARKNDLPIVFEVPKNADVECLLQKGPETIRDWFSCKSPLDLPGVLQVRGQYTLRIRIVGNPETAAQTEAVLTFFAVVKEPDTEITDSHADPSDRSSYCIGFAGVEKGIAFFECNLNFAERWEECESPKIYRNLPHGENAFRVRAVDNAGHKDPTPAEHHFEIQPPFSVPTPSVPDARSTSSPSGKTRTPKKKKKQSASVASDIREPFPSPFPSSEPSPVAVVFPNLPSSPSPSPSPSRPPSPSLSPEIVSTSPVQSETSNHKVVRPDSPSVQEDKSRVDVLTPPDAELVENPERSGSVTNEPELDPTTKRSTTVQTFSPDTLSAVIVITCSALAALVVCAAVVCCCSRGPNPCCRTIFRGFLGRSQSAQAS